MIYIEEKLFEKQLELLSFFNSPEKLDLIIWFFPETKLRTICGLTLAPKDLVEGEQITTYGDGFKPKKTRKVKFTSDLLIKIKASSKAIQENCDSLALYPHGEKKWLVCMIEHEGICLVSDNSFIEALLSKGFNASLEKPEWW
jgi:hypothetical protein